MSARFTLDLLHPGFVAASWQDWFVGPQGARRLLVVAGICAGVILLVVITLVLPPTFRLSRDQGAIPKLRADLLLSPIGYRFDFVPGRNRYTVG